MAYLSEKIEKSEGYLEKANKTAVPVLGVIAAIVALIGSQDALIKYPAIVVSVILTLGVIYSPVYSFFKFSRGKLFPRRLSSEQRNRLTMLLQESPNYVSSSHSYSVFATWGSLAQSLKIPNWNRSEYFDVVRHQLNDMCELTDKFQDHESYMLEKISMVVRNVASAAESVRRELEAELLKEEVEERVRKQVKAGWNECVGTFNAWLKEWERLFREANHFVGTRCADYISVIKRID